MPNGRMYYHIGGFIDDQQIIVFIKISSGMFSGVISISTAGGTLYAIMSPGEILKDGSFTPHH
jgi:hypothetical protein